MNGDLGFLRCFVGALLALTAAACAEPQVTRVYEGNPVSGRFIEYEAYAAYGRGLEAMHDRNFRVAARWFEEAAKYDPKSVEIPTHLGSVLCKMGGPEKAADAFARAEELEPRFAPLFQVRAECEMDHGDSKAAAIDAARAFQLDPNDDAIVVTYAQALVALEKNDEAGRLLDSYLVRYPNAIPAWWERHSIAKNQGDRGMIVKSSEILVRLAPRLIEEAIAEDPELGPLAKVDAAIRRGDIDEARRAARHAHVPPAELALRAAAMGATKLAREQAEHVLGADPASTSARVALASASDALEDATAVNKALELPKGERLTPLSPLGKLVFAELLVRHAERGAARAFLGSLDGQATKDPVYEALRLHLAGRLGGTSPVKVGGT